LDTRGAVFRSSLPGGGVVVGGVGGGGGVVFPFPHRSRVTHGPPRSFSPQLSAARARLSDGLGCFCLEKNDLDHFVLPRDSNELMLPPAAFPYRGEWITTSPVAELEQFFSLR